MTWPTSIPVSMTTHGANHRPTPRARFRAIQRGPTSSLQTRDCTSRIMTDQRDTAEGLVAANHHVVVGGRRTRDRAGLAVAVEVRPAVVACRRGLAALLDVEVGVAGAAADREHD